MLAWWDGCTERIKLKMEAPQNLFYFGFNGDDRRKLPTNATKVVVGKHRTTLKRVSSQHPIISLMSPLRLTNTFVSSVQNTTTTTLLFSIPKITAGFGHSPSYHLPSPLLPPSPCLNSIETVDVFWFGGCDSFSFCAAHAAFCHFAIRTFNVKAAGI